MFYFIPIDKVKPTDSYSLKIKKALALGDQQGKNIIITGSNREARRKKLREVLYGTKSSSTGKA